MLCSTPILCYPRFDREFILQTDASDFGVGALLLQIDDKGREKVIAYASKALSARHEKFSATEKEAHAIVFGTQQFRVYLLGRHFQIVTDHNALRWLHSMEPKGHLARWILDLQEFNFSIVHRAGHLHNNADALSRLVWSPCKPPAQHSASSLYPTALVPSPAPSVDHTNWRMVAWIGGYGFCGIRLEEDVEP